MGRKLEGAKIKWTRKFHWLGTLQALRDAGPSKYCPVDSTTNRLLYLGNEIHEAFENPKSLEVWAVFLDISKAFDKVWHDSLIFKLKQNGISVKLLKRFENYLHSREHCLVLNDSNYDYSIIESGVPKVQFLILYAFSYTSMISKEILNPISSFSLTIPCFFQ